MEKRAKLTSYFFKKTSQFLLTMVSWYKVFLQTQLCDYLYFSIIHKTALVRLYKITKLRKQKGEEMRLKKTTHFLKYSKESVCRVWWGALSLKDSAYHGGDSEKSGAFIVVVLPYLAVSHWISVHLTVLI